MNPWKELEEKLVKRILLFFFKSSILTSGILISETENEDDFSIFNSSYQILPHEYNKLSNYK